MVGSLEKMFTKSTWQQLTLRQNNRQDNFTKESAVFRDPLWCPGLGFDDAFLREMGATPRHPNLSVTPLVLSKKFSELKTYINDVLRRRKSVDNHDDMYELCVVEHVPSIPEVYSYLRMVEYCDLEGTNDIILDTLREEALVDYGPSNDMDLTRTPLNNMQSKKSKPHNSLSSSQNSQMHVDNLDKDVQTILDDFKQIVTKLKSGADKLNAIQID
ncbi:hypothetical protein GUITHDRAFT_114332 [Guillardia theta CCMP2712]|uniref:Uncharacterized protein n=1 Tax=Guillardia theta (strain CCMP2712) TaxID=905079 RepID=L1ITP0_GUITC|nr:hypothetical protein GUITHDRAFT_114332 [Guillardia theta CCMP2712]EKX39603.1 hypothetical protein GUITHDRAFT_114332 [Guillardia theta CCMP2712]|eukprot:XP_005826583.1 hypothetical protein GUITHDRAFT_114332 [Guillardia theta CCMP2712]